MLYQLSYTGNKWLEGMINISTTWRLWPNSDEEVGEWLAAPSQKGYFWAKTVLRLKCKVFLRLCILVQLMRIRAKDWKLDNLEGFIDDRPLFVK